MLRHFRITLRELLLLTAVTAASLAAVRYASLEMVLWAGALQVLLIMMVPMVIVGGGWKRHPFAIGFLLGLVIFRYLPGIQHPSYVTQAILTLVPQPQFYGTPAYDYWSSLIDSAVGLHLCLACGWIARTASQAAADANRIAP